MRHIYLQISSEKGLYHFTRLTSCTEHSGQLKDTMYSQMSSSVISALVFVTEYRLNENNSKFDTFTIRITDAF